jgi:predicted acyltransferase
MATLITDTFPEEKPALEEVPLPAAPRPEKPARLVSLDAYRGFIMLVMASSQLGIPRVARFFQDSTLWQFLAHQFDHVPWIDTWIPFMTIWDLIQPSFMFMVGVAIPYSYASRKAKGDSEAQIWSHVLWRSFVLVALGVFLSSANSPRPISPFSRGAGLGVTGVFAAPLGPQTDFVFVNVLAQIGLGYSFVYLLRGRGVKMQLAAIAAILVGYTLLFAAYPAPGPDFDYASVRRPSENWQPLTGWFAHWEKNTNAAHAFDVWFLNLFPRTQPFRFNEGGYQTLNFVPSMATMLLGLMAGELLRRSWSGGRKFLVLVLASLICLGLGWLAGEYVCPIVKRIWTPSWVLFSAGWTFALLAGFYFVIDLVGFRRWAFPLVVVGMNSIAMYCMSQLIKGWVLGRLKVHFGQWWFTGPYGPMVETSVVLLVLWLICYWMYRRGIFLRI